GTAGCVLAARLSEDPSLRVLLIEDGGSGKGVPESRIPSAFTKLWHSQYDYDLLTEPQENAAGRKIFWPRGEISDRSSINAQMAQYGAPSDFDEWARIIGDDSWSWNNFNKYFRKFEDFTPNSSYPHINASNRGKGGPVSIGYNSYTFAGSPLFVKAAMNVGIPFSGDFGLETSMKGTNMVMTYVDSHSERVSTETAYLTDKVLARPNLSVLTRHRVTKLLFERVADGTPCATGVEFVRVADGTNGKKWRVKSRKEVIVSAGAVHSPQILMLSGIGAAEHLAEHNIPLVHDLRGVGMHLTDHTVVHHRFADKKKVTFNFGEPYDVSTYANFFMAALRYQLFGTGPFASNVSEAVIFVRSDDQSLFPKAEWQSSIEDANSGPDSLDIELLIFPVLVNTDETFHIKRGAYGYMIVATNLRPTSRGTIRLKSSDPFDNPLMDPNYLATKHAVDVHVRTAHLTHKIAHTAPMTEMTDTDCQDRTFDHHIVALPNEDLEQFIRGRIQTLYHPSCTCRMAPLDEGGVVDKDLNVYGVKGLRVCDASVFPELISGHSVRPNVHYELNHTEEMLVCRPVP
ncbi:alcohol oxidase, partial [Coniophora puteana RWD-64-598 SS2]